MPELLKSIQVSLKNQSSEEAARSIRKFVPGSENIYGVKNPVLNEMAKEMKFHGWPLVNELWNSGAYEEKLLAAKIVRLFSKKEAEEKLRWVRKISGDIADWATCDTVGMQCLKNSNKILAEKIFDLSRQLIRSNNFWERRLALVLVEDFTKTPGYHDAILSLIEAVKDDKEYYVKKAVEWIRRNLKKKVKDKNF